MEGSVRFGMSPETHLDFRNPIEIRRGLALFRFYRRRIRKDTKGKYWLENWAFCPFKSSREWSVEWHATAVVETTSCYSRSSDRFGVPPQNGDSSHGCIEHGNDSLE